MSVSNVFWSFSQNLTNYNYHSMISCTILVFVLTAHLHDVSCFLTVQLMKVKNIFMLHAKWTAAARTPYWEPSHQVLS